MVVAILVVAGSVVPVGATNQASADCAIASTLRVGSAGFEVQCLQGIIGVTADGKFGPMTLAAVKVWQASHGLVADGIVGPITRAALNAQGQVSGNFTAGCTSSVGYSPITGVKCDSISTGLPAGCTSTVGYSPLTGVKCDSAITNLPAGCTSTIGYSPTTGVKCDSNVTDDDDDDSPLQGGAGDITLTLRGTYSSEEVGEGEEDAKILHVDVEADDDSDVELNSVKVEFFQATTADDRDLPDYASEVSVWLNGKEVGRAKTSSFTESSNYFSRSINLSGAIIRAGDEDELVIAISANNSLDSGDIDTDAWQVDIINVRFTDAAGVTTTESGSASATAGAGTYGKLFDFASFATANDAELTLTLEDDEINDVHLLDSDDSKDTDHPILSVLFDASGESDIWVDEVQTTITTTGEEDESVIVVSTWIEVNGVRISEKEDVPAGGAVTYDDLDYTIKAGHGKEFVFWVTMQDVDGALDDGDTVQMTLDTSDTVAEDEVGDTVVADGSDPVGGTHLLYDNGIRLVGNSQVATAFTIDGVNNDRVELELIFDV
ncbi:peptidoglycan-binding protein, partial [Candidatus Nomurabacteria bacterium]|nr:peptidoglycan-binding protein [Candidatus Nomurabacteria bacterium]